MRFDGGFITISRDYEHLRWLLRHAYVKRIWDYILLYAAFKDHTTSIKGHVFDLKRGDLITTIVELSDGCGLDRKQIRTGLKILKDRSIISHKRDKKYLVITFLNYSEFQDIHRVVGTDPGQKMDTTGTQPGHILDTTGTEDGHNRDTTGTLAGHIRTKTTKTTKATRANKGQPRITRANKEKKDNNLFSEGGSKDSPPPVMGSNILFPDSSPSEGMPKPEIIEAKPVSETYQVWIAYRDSMKRRYGTDSKPNSKKMSLCKNLISQVGFETAMRLAEFYPTHPDRWLLQNCHPLEILIKNPDRFNIQLEGGGYITGDIAKRNEINESNSSAIQRFIERNKR